MSRFLQELFDVFSRRPEAQSKPNHEVPQTTRHRVLYWCREVFSNSRQPEYPGPGVALAIGGGGDYTQEFWHEIHHRILYRSGGVGLPESNDPVKQTISYLWACSGETFLDFLEDIFKVECYFHVTLPAKQAVEELNQLLREDKLPYHLTHLVTETVSNGRGYTIHTLAYPQVIMKESEFLHTQAIVPVLTLLQQPHFKNANKEFLEALEDYRKGDITDCLTKCGSSLESVLKVICDRKGWTYNQTDPAKKLLDIVLPKTNLDGYFEQLFIIVATLRNKLSSSHGAGTVAKQPTPHLGQYALNATASAIILLAQETGEY